MSAAGIACIRAASRSRLALAAFSTNWRGVSGLLSYPTAAAAAAASSPSSSGPFLYGNRRGQVLHISQFVKANGMRVDTLALVPSKHLVHKGTGGRSPVRTLAAGIACIRGASRSRLAIAAFSTNRRGVNNLISNPTTAASPSSSGSFLYGNRQGQVLRISQFVKANGVHVDTLALVRRMEAQGLPLKHVEAIMLVITKALNDEGGMLKGEMIRDANLSKLHSQDQLCFKSHFRSRRCFSSTSGPAPPSPSSRGKGEVFIDTHTIAKRLVKEGVSDEVAGVAASLIIETVNDSFDRIAKSYPLKSLMEQKNADLESLMKQKNADLESYFKLELQILKAEIKGLKADIEGHIKDLKFGVVRYTLGFLVSLCTACIAWLFRDLVFGSKAKDL